MARGATAPKPGSWVAPDGAGARLQAPGTRGEEPGLAAAQDCEFCSTRISSAVRAEWCRDLCSTGWPTAMVQPQLLRCTVLQGSGSSWLSDPRLLTLPEVGTRIRPRSASEVRFPSGARAAVEFPATATLQEVTDFVTCSAHLPGAPAGLEVTAAACLAFRRISFCSVLSRVDGGMNLVWHIWHQK